MLEVGHAVIDLRTELTRTDTATTARASIMQALHHVARLFDRPTPRRFDAALSATTLAIDDLRAQLDTVRERCEERHRLQRMSSHLHFIRTALLDPQSPLGHLNSRPKERPMPRDIAILDAYIPTILLLFIAGGLLTWFIDRLLAADGFVSRGVASVALSRVSVRV